MEETNYMVIRNGQEVEFDQGCVLHKQLVSVERKSAFSVIQKENYCNYDGCHKYFTNCYSNYNFTGVWAGIVILSLVFAILVGMIVDEKLRNAK